MRARRPVLDQLRPALSNADLFTYSTGEIRNYEAFLGYDFTTRLGELEMPVLIVHGTSDGTVPFEYAERMHHLIPGSDFHAIEGADHGITAYPEAQTVTSAWLQRMATLTRRRVTPARPQRGAEKE
jgi:pimeloyl-ACP methyl ester carboxylesterase